MKRLLILPALLALAGCVTTGNELRPTDKSAVCRALVDPIKYNSRNPKSRRYAGDLLALDLKQRNQIGQNLRCPQFR